MKTMSHLDERGKARMVDVSDKRRVKRTAIAEGRIRMHVDTVARIRENAIEKGDVLAVAKIAGIQAAKETSRLIPLCHPLALSFVDVSFEIEEDAIRVASEVVCVEATGVEMEALTAVNVALLTIYDMCKAIDKEMVMSDVRLLEKRKEALA